MNKLTLSFILLACLVLSGCPTDREEETQLVAGKLHTMSFVSSARGHVGMEVYLPPTWDPQKSEGYPVIFFLHGGTGDEFSFFRDVDYQQLNQWIEQAEVPPFVLVALESQYHNGEEQQWSSPANEAMLTSEADFELRAFTRNTFNAGIMPGSVSVHGQSRGARGALHYAFKFPQKFVSAMSNAFVSDYAVAEEKANALQNIDRINSSGIKIRMVIGTEDEWVLQQNRQASYLMHDYLYSLSIEHEFEILVGAGHQLRSMWNTQSVEGLSNGLYELKQHAQAWENAASSE